MSFLDIFRTVSPGSRPQKIGGTPGGDRQGKHMLSIEKTLEKVKDETALIFRDTNVFDFIYEGFTTLTAVQANIILRECQFDGQRKISQDHVSVLADIMKSGKWEPKDKLDFAHFNGRLVLVNGYHRMMAVVACGKSIEWTIVIHPCRTEDAVRSLYYKFDTNTRIRSGRQILAGVGFAEKAGLSNTVAAGLFAAVPFIAGNFSTSKMDRDILTVRNMDRRLKVASEYVEAAKRYEACLNGVHIKEKKKFLSGGVAAVALVTLRYQAVTATDFWMGAAQNDGLRKGDPRKTFHDDLISRQMNAGLAAQSIISPALAWNAFFEGRPLKIIKAYDRRSVRIAGTPWEG